MTIKHHSCTRRSHFYKHHETTINKCFWRLRDYSVASLTCPKEHRVVGVCCISLAIAGCGDNDVSTPFPDGGMVDPPTTLRTPSTGTSLNRAARNTAFVCPRAPLPALPPLYRPNTPWVRNGFVIAAEIPFVRGSVNWRSEFAMTMTATQRRLVGNGLPNHPTGTFPVEPGTPAYQYYSALPADGYANAAKIPIGPYEIDLTLPRIPVANATPACIHSIFTGVVSQTGAAWHLDLAIDGENRVLDPIAGLPEDQCWGHPYATQYHYHGYSWKCFPNQGRAGEHSPLFGYAIDGFGVYGPRGERGVPVTNADLDECHGHTHAIEWDGETRVMYHYHQNNEYPYSIGCYRGTPITLPSHLQH
jgi:hypothetical protein